MHLTKTYSAALVASLLTAAPAIAAAVSAPVAPPARALLLIPLTLTKVQDLHFGSVIPSGLPGTVTIDAATGNRTGSPEVSLIPSDAGQKGYFAGAGSPNQQVIMALTPATILTDGLGNNITVASMSLDGPNTRTIDPVDHTFFVGVGGVLNIDADQPEGVYTATYNLTADYQ
ncbi:MAG: DUF4402 domain-containing protein [Sphingomicrobium sp.]